MNLKTFIQRPVLSSVISVVIVLAGLIAVRTLPVEQFPDIAPPTIMVMTSYPGASAETVQNSVIAPLEEAINGVENMDYMQSTATNSGSVEIMVYFKQGTDADMAAVNVQNRVAQANGSLPAEVTRIGVTTIKQQNSIIKIIDVHATKESGYDTKFLANYSKLNIEPQMKRIKGVGNVVLLSDQYAMRIWFNPAAMAHYNLIPDDITRVLGEQNIESATGSFGENSAAANEYIMKYSGRKKTPEEFGEMVVSATPSGEVLRLRDVAHVELGVESYGYSSTTDGEPGVEMMVFQIAGSNATQVVNDIDALIEETSETLPKGVSIDSMLSVNDFLYASIKEVVKSLLLAILLVVLVVYFFLQDFRATLIPTVGIFVAVIGTFAFMSVAGFTINLLTLFALVLAIGTVVDNAIVVVEAVQAKLNEGYTSPMKATVDAMGGIAAAILTSTLVFMAVFIPVSMMGGTSGVFYTQFGITMAVAVGISAVNALTLAPALCAILLKPYVGADGREIDSFSARFRKKFNSVFSRIVEKYKTGALFFIKRTWLVWSMIAGCIVLLVALMSSTKSGLVPDEDMGTVMVDVQTAPGTGLRRTDEVLLEVYARIKDLPEIERASTVTGYGMLGGSGTSYGSITIKLKDWSKRKGSGHDVNAVIAKIMELTADIKDAQIIPMAPPMINGYGMTNGFEMYLQDRTGGDVGEFFKVAQNFLEELGRRPEIEQASTSFSPDYPQYLVDVDAAKCKIAGISPSTVLSTLSGYYGGQYVSNINRFSHVYRVTVQADPAYRMTPQSLDAVMVRTDNGEMAPISQFLQLTKVYGPQSLSRFNMYNAISVNGSAADGFSSGDAIRAVKEVAASTLPMGFGFEFSGLAREEERSSSNSLYIYLICIVLIYLILCAFYESFLIPLAVIVSVPCGVMGSFLFAKFFGLENNIYLQTGVIMLIGLLAKTAILITEYASKRRRAGLSIKQSAVGAAKVRLRPILMTALTMVFGMLPMMFSSGVGANGNSALGTGAVGGMLVGTLILLFFVPALFVTFETLEERVKPIKFEQSEDASINGEISVVREMKKANGEEDNTVKF